MDCPGLSGVHFSLTRADHVVAPQGNPTRVGLARSSLHAIAATRLTENRRRKIDR